MSFQVIDAGSIYQLDGDSKLTFLKKEKKEGAAPSEPMVTVQEGTTNEDVIRVLIDRISHLNGKVSSEENRLAISHLEMALEYLESRTRRRVAQAIEGTALPDA